MSREAALAGFADAQQRLRDKIGADVVFLGDVEVTWPEDTRLDDDGEPFDAFVEPASSAQASAVVRCTVAFRPLGSDSDAETGALGWVDRQHVLLTAPSAAASAVHDRFILHEETYQVTGSSVDGLGIVSQLLVYGRRQ